MLSVIRTLISYNRFFDSKASALASGAAQRRHLKQREVKEQIYNSNTEKTTSCEDSKRIYFFFFLKQKQLNWRLCVCVDLL